MAEEEPRLKFSNLNGDVPSILSHDAATCLCVSDKVVALGTAGGAVHLLDYDGNEVGRCNEHGGSIKDLSFDARSEILASGALDGSITVQNLVTHGVEKFSSSAPVTTVALDPRYGQRKTREVIVGDVKGTLSLSSQGWLGASKTVLFRGRGAILAARMSGTYLAWATSTGVRVYNTADHARLGKLDSSQWFSTDVNHPGNCCLIWAYKCELVVGWHSHVLIAHVLSTTLQIVSEFDVSMDSTIAGIAPFDDDFVILLQNELDYSLAIYNRQGQQLSCDSLCIRGNASLYYASSLQRNEEATYFILGPHELVVARPMDGNDRVMWLSERQRYDEALTVAEMDLSVKSQLAKEIGQAYLDHLMVVEKDFKKASQIAAKVLRDDALAWERCVFSFTQARALGELVPYLPVETPRLNRETYDMILRALVLSKNDQDHERLLLAVKRWPASLYDTNALLGNIQSQKHRVSSASLIKAAATLHTQQGNFLIALDLFVAIHDIHVFEYLQKYSLLGMAPKHVVGLMDTDERYTMQLLIGNTEEADPAIVVKTLQKHIKTLVDAKEQKLWRSRLHQYLDLCFKQDASATTQFAELQAELYAEFEPSRLLAFLDVCASCPLESALKVCERQGLIKESVFVLGRMGAADRALRVIVNQLKDIEGAVEFAASQQDDDLWDLLITLALADPELAGSLLDHSAGQIDPLTIVLKIPEHMEIQNLKHRLVNLIHDHRASSSLHQGAAVVLTSDCAHLAERMYKELRSALRSVFVRVGDEQWTLYNVSSGEHIEQKKEQVPDGGRHATPWVGFKVKTRRISTPPSAMAASPSKFPLSSRGKKWQSHRKDNITAGS